MFVRYFLVRQAHAAPHTVDIYCNDSITIFKRHINTTHYLRRQARRSSAIARIPGKERS